MDYKITAADAALGQIEVTYLNNGETVAAYAIDVPIVDGRYITGDVLAAEIVRRAPVWLLERKNQAATAGGFEQINALVQAPSAQESVSPAQTIINDTTPVVESRQVAPTLVSNSSVAEVL